MLFAEMPILENRSVPLPASEHLDKPPPYRPRASVEQGRTISSKHIISIRAFSNGDGPALLGIWWILLRNQKATAQLALYLARKLGALASTI
jgi:hypothetical protein